MDIPIETLKEYIADSGKADLWLGPGGSRLSDAQLVEKIGLGAAATYCMDMEAELKKDVHSLTHMIAVETVGEVRKHAPDASLGAPYVRDSVLPELAGIILSRGLYLRGADTSAVRRALAECLETYFLARASINRLYAEGCRLFDGRRAEAPEPAGACRGSYAIGYAEGAVKTLYSLREKSGLPEDCRWLPPLMEGHDADEGSIDRRAAEVVRFFLGAGPGPDGMPGIADIMERARGGPRE